MTDITTDINYPKVVYEQLRRWRIARKPLLEALDIEFMKALETNNEQKKAEVTEQKQTLRDITNYDFSALSSVSDVYDVWPEVLGAIPDEFRSDN